MRYLTNNIDNTIFVEELKYDVINNRAMSLFGAFSEADVIKFTVRFVRCAPDAVAMVIHKDAWNSGHTAYCEIPFDSSTSDEYKTAESTVFTKIIDIKSLLDKYDDSVGLFYYHYSVKFGDNYIDFGGEEATTLLRIEHKIGERQLLIYDKDYHTSKSYSEGVIYHVFVDRFKRSGRCPVKEGAEFNENWGNGIPQYGEYPGAHVLNNVFFGGDLYGVADEIDYIKSLGVRTIYLSPVFDAFSNHKYDTADYLTVDSMFGGDDALEYLCKTAKEKGIDVILDGVFNHTGSDSIYFNKDGKYSSVGAYQSKDSPYSDWYNFKNFPDEYECWWGVKILPRIESNNPEFRSFICDKVVSKWMKMGVSGWRLDVADELDNKFLEDFRKAVKKHNKDGVILGEVWEDASDKISYGYRREYLCGNQLDSVMNYPLRNAVIEYVKYGNAALLKKNTETLYRRYPKETSDNLLNFLGTHDTERILTLLGGVDTGDKTNKELSTLRMTEEERDSAKSLLKLAYGIIAGLPGSPCVFYGDEAGLEGYRDPFCRKPFPWKSIDTELLDYYRKVGNIRREYTVFRDGLFKIIYLDKDVFIYDRTPYNGSEEYKIIVCASRSRCKICLTQVSSELICGKESREFVIEKNCVLYLKSMENAAVLSVIKE